MTRGLYILVCKLCDTEVGEGQERAMVEVNNGPGRKTLFIAHRECAERAKDEV